MSILPDTYYRVSVKALVFDADNRLLVFMDKAHEWEMPGGGWEYDETLEACLIRELFEEAHAVVTNVSGVKFCYRGHMKTGEPKLYLAARVTLDSMHFMLTEQALAEASFVTRDEFLKLPFQKGEADIKDFADQIWPSKKAKAS